MNVITVQGVGSVPAVMAKELRPGDRIVLDGGYIYTVRIVQIERGRVTAGIRDHAGRLHRMQRRPEEFVGLAV